jgi:16S rRNA (adenine1518-N6/adenine1519-N6)-dimethyltransferase
MRLSKELGQVFLRDKRYIHKIINSLDIKDRYVLEIGSGRGQITQYLAKKASYLWCVELDLRLANYLKKEFSSYNNIEIINKDILKLDLSGLGNLINQKLVIFGNIPYNISNRLIRYLIRERNWVDKAYLTLQKEFARKLAALPCDKSYSFLSCYIQYYSRVDVLFHLPKTAFFPSPQVDSSFVVIDFFEKPLYPVKDISSLFKLIRTGFTQRRKKLLNSLAPLYGKEKLKEVFSRLGVDLDVRAQDLSLENYCKITDYLNQLLNQKDKSSGVPKSLKDQL